MNRGIFCPSDQRVKQCVETLDDISSLNKLRSLDSKTYKYYGENTHLEYGFIAQEVAQIVPECVNTYSHHNQNIRQYFNYQVVDDNPRKIKILDISSNLFNIEEKVLVERYSNIVESTIISKDVDFLILEFTYCEFSPSGQIFILGQLIDNCLFLNKDYLYMINFSATKELDRILQWQMNNLDLTRNANAQTTYGNSIKSRIEKLENKIVQPPPTNINSSGETGAFSYDSEYFYVCVGTNNWKRTTLSGW
jgi:hypothetical protein